MTQPNPNLKTLKCDGSLTETDMNLLAGTEILENMLKNRILVIKEEPQGDINWVTLCSNIEGFYHIKALDSKRVYQVWFQFPHDKEQFEKNLMLSKLS